MLKRVHPPRSVWFGAMLIACACLFRHTGLILICAGGAWVIYRAVFARDKRIILCLVSAGLSLTLFEWAGAGLLRRHIAEKHQLDIDHRLKPDSAAGINADGIRSAVECDDFSAETFNIIFLGDSFTYGNFLNDPRDPFPAQLEEMLRRPGESSRVRCVNFGWPSSSPLLSYRLLRDIGAKYKPDLVVLCLDMTDFHDDLRYRDATGLGHLSPTRFLLELAGLGGVAADVRSAWRWSGPSAADSFPADRYFPCNQPLDQSAPYMLETESNLRRISQFCQTTLKVPFALVMFPRSFQYDERECPHNWEAPRYTIMGPFAHEPFRWLAKYADRAGFSCDSVLQDFKSSGVFPTCFERDPHWNRAGHTIMARAVLRVLQDRKLLPESP